MTKILVIDDSAMVRRILRQYLEQAGYTVEDWLPLSAMDIPDRIIASAPDLVLSDYQMPGVNGLTVAKMVLRANPNVPVVILTALRDSEMEINLRKFGVKCILGKPIDAESLVRAVQDVLSKA